MRVCIDGAVFDPHKEKVLISVELSDEDKRQIASMLHDHHIYSMGNGGWDDMGEAVDALPQLRENNKVLIDSSEIPDYKNPIARTAPHASFCDCAACKETRREK